MRTGLRRAFHVTMLAGAVALVLADHPSAAVSSHKINAKASGQDYGNGTTSARVIGGGLLSGTTSATFTPTDFSNYPPVLGITGDVTFSTNEGATLTVHVTGTFDGSTGEFSATGSVVDATGRLAGATGSLTFTGVEDLSDGTFVEDITGNIYVNLAP